MPSDTLCPITVRSDEGQPLSLALRGDLNIYQVHQLYEAAVALLPEESDVAVSCKDVVQIDAAVLQVLLVLQGDLKSRGKRMQFMDLSAGLRELLELAGVDETLAG